MQSLLFRESAKVNTQPSFTRLNLLLGKPKETAEQPEPLLLLRLNKDSLNNDGIAIRFSKTASPKFDIDEDAADLGGNGALESLSVFSSDSVALSIDYTSYPGKQAEVIRLFTGAPDWGPYSLDVPALDDLPALYGMWLKDAFTGDS